MTGFISDRVSGGEEVTLLLQEVKNKEKKRENSSSCITQVSYMHDLYETNVSLKYSAGESAGGHESSYSFTKILQSPAFDDALSLSGNI